MTFSGLRLAAPQFRVTRGQGRYDPATGALAVSADAYSNQYGPLTARVTGSQTNPVVVLSAPRPGVGVGLANLQARIVGQNGAYAVNAKGDTNYGPFTANVWSAPGGNWRSISAAWSLPGSMPRAAWCRRQRGRSPARCNSPDKGSTAASNSPIRGQPTRRYRRAGL